MCWCESSFALIPCCCSTHSQGDRKPTFEFMHSPNTPSENLSQKRWRDWAFHFSLNPTDASHSMRWLSPITYTIYHKSKTIIVAFPMYCRVCFLLSITVYWRILVFNFLDSEFVVNLCALCHIYCILKSNCFHFSPLLLFRRSSFFPSVSFRILFNAQS